VSIKETVLAEAMQDPAFESFAPAATRRLVDWMADPVHRQAFKIAGHLTELVVMRGARMWVGGIYGRVLRLPTVTAFMRVPNAQDPTPPPGCLPSFWTVWSATPTKMIFTIGWTEAPDVRFSLGHFERGDWEEAVLSEKSHSALPDRGACSRN
jgi:hypothetical protein